MEQICFLTYIPRSGSTFLANMLNKYKDIGVTIEARLPDGTKYAPVEINTLADLENAMGRLYSDDKFRAWNIDRGGLKEALSNLEFPISYDRFFKTILSKHFNEKKLKILIHKCGFYIEYIDHIKTMFPASKFVFLLRDARAIYNSQKTTLGSRSLKPMINNPIPTSRRYKKVLSILEKYQGVEWLYLLKYEDLINNTEGEINKLLAFLGIDTPIKDNDKSYLDKIPKSQKHLHLNVAAEPLKDKIDAWEKGLTKAEIMIIQDIVGDLLNKYGYKSVNVNKISMEDKYHCLLYLLKDIAARAQNRIYREFSKIKNVKMQVN